MIWFYIVAAIVLIVAIAVGRAFILDWRKSDYAHVRAQPKVVGGES